MSLAGRTLPLVVVARTREVALSALEGREKDRQVDPGIDREGSNRLAARAGGAYLIWGVTPSPLALKVAENVLALYEGEDKPPNRVFYACYAGTHSSVVAASLHAGLLDGDPRDGGLLDGGLLDGGPLDGSPLHSRLLDGGRRLCDLPMFDRRVAADVGVPALVGVDGMGTEVYALGTGWLSASLEKPVCDLIEVASPRARACICSVRGFLDFPARVGGFASRRCFMVWPGRNLIASSLARKAPDIGRAVRFCLDLSKRWKDNEGQPKGEVIWVDGSKAGRPSVGSSRGEPGGVPWP